MGHPDLLQGETPEQADSSTQHNPFRIYRFTGQGRSGFVVPIQ
jgi:hypothetical protein